MAKKSNKQGAKTASKKSAAKKVVAVKKSYKPLSVHDFKVDQPYLVADSRGNVNPVPVNPKGTLAQQATKFNDALLRGGVFEVEAKKTAKPKKVVERNRVVSAKANTKTAVGEKKTRSLPSEKIVSGDKPIDAGRTGVNTTNEPPQE